MDPKAEIPAISLKFPIPQAHFCVEYCLKVVRWAHRVFIGNIYIYYVVTGLYRLYKDKKVYIRGDAHGEMGREGEREGEDKRME